MPTPIRILLLAIVPAMVLLAPVPAQATFPGRNGDISFLCYQYDQLLSVCKIPAAGGTRRRLAGEATGSTSAPRWAPNGRHLLFKSTDESALDLVRLPGFRSIPESEGLFEPAWSPRGDRIAAVRYARRQRGIFTLGVNGRNKRLEIPNGASPDWSPNGRTLAYDLRGEIYLYDLARRRSKRLTHSPRGSSAHLASWAPDGRRIAFERRTGPVASRSVNIFTMRANGTGVRQVTHNPARGPIAGDSDPVWSPDGRFIAYIHAPDNDTGFFLHVIDSNGSNQRTLTGPPGYFGPLAPDWGRLPR